MIRRHAVLINTNWIIHTEGGWLITGKCWWPAWVKMYIWCCVEVDGPISSFSCCQSYVEVDERVSVEVCGYLRWCLYRCPKCHPLSMYEIFASIDNFTRLWTSTIVGRTCCAVRSFLYWFATTKFNILLSSVCCHRKRKWKHLLVQSYWKN